MNTSTLQQPMPQPGQADVTEQVIADLKERRKKGVETYGRQLQTFNGRDALVDAYQEVLDTAQYLKQAILERDLLHADTQIRLLPLPRNCPGAAVMLNAAFAAAQAFDCTIHDLISPQRGPQHVSDARRVAWLLLRCHTRIGTPEIGRYFGGRDHGTILDGVAKIRELILTVPELRAGVEAAEKAFAEITKKA